MRRLTSKRGSIESEKAHSVESHNIRIPKNQSHELLNQFSNPTSNLVSRHPSYAPDRFYYGTNPTSNKTLNPEYNQWKDASALIFEPRDSAITEESEIEEMNFNRSFSSLDDYNFSDSEDLPTKEIEDTKQIIGNKDIDPVRLAAKMNRIKQTLSTLKHFMRVAKQGGLKADYEKIKEKHDKVKRTMSCLSTKELRQMKQLELFTSPYNQD